MIRPLARLPLAIWRRFSSHVAECWGVSLRYRGIELLRRLENLEAAAEKGSTAGIPLLYPWANRLESLTYRTAGKKVDLAVASPLLHFDDNGLPIHGVPWALLPWDVLDSSHYSHVAQLNWNRSDLLAIFPFPHRVEMTATILADCLRIETVVISEDEPVPASILISDCRTSRVPSGN